MSATTPDKRPTATQRLLEMAVTDPQLRELMPDPAVTDVVGRPDCSYEQAVLTVLGGYPSRPALGERAYDVTVDRATGRHQRTLRPNFDTITYATLCERVTALAELWRRDPRWRIEPDEFVVTMGFSGIDYATVDFACVLARAVVVPVQATLAGADLDGVFTATEPVVVAATIDDLVVAAGLAASHRSVRYVIAMDYDERVDDDRDQLAAARSALEAGATGAEIVVLDELVAAGDAAHWEPLPPLPGSEERMCMVLHSSGSTGTPKGAIINEKKAKFHFARVPPVPVPVVRLCFAPMNHFMGRSVVHTTLTRGGTAYFTARPDLSTLLEDFRLVRPTEAGMFPRVLDLVHRHYQTEVSRRVAAGEGDRESVRAAVMAEMRTGFLGDRIVTISNGSAPLTPEVRSFIEECFQLTIAEGYGTTEAGGITAGQRVTRPPVIDYRLRDVPELGYFTTDAPYPRGELWVKTEHTVPGYYKNPEATAALWDDEGFQRTGDIMEERGPDHLAYIDRRNDVLKLSQGEFVAVGALGNVFENASKAIRQMYLYGNSARAFLVAVIVPDTDQVTHLLGPDASPAQVKGLLREELNNVARSENLRSFEVPRDFIVEYEPFTYENGLLSSMQKRLRPALRRHYGDALEGLYAALEIRQQSELAALRDPSHPLTILEKVAKALEATLGIEALDVSQPLAFTELGGDSLGAVSFSALLEDLFGVEVPVNAILSPAGNPMQWARLIEESLADAHRALPTCSQVHGKGAVQLRARDLDIARLIAAELFGQVPADEPPVESKSVLLTGATGFLGRFMCLEWLERMKQRDGKVVCLVRAPDAASARARIVAGFAADDELVQTFEELAASHLEVVVGDVAEPRLGLDDATYERLAGELDRIVHPAALVNHMLDYQYLFGPNVAGTAELVALALAQRVKRFDFVSSLAVARYVDHNAGNDEDSPLLDQVTLTGEYTAGYGASKWAAEQLLQSAHRSTGLPINIFRCDMILPHARYHGQINVPDIFVRLLFSLMATGIAPASFYERRPDGSRASAHYDGLPVDFVAAALVSISELPNNGVATYNAVNHHHDDGISLDTFVDWMGAAGHPIELVDSHPEWVARFEERLNALPEDRRQHSSLMVLDSLRKPYTGEAMARDSRHFADALRWLPTPMEVPHLSREYLLKCLDDLDRHGLAPSGHDTLYVP